ncbi:MAG: FecR domain-containing protein, partial [Novosphingobium sp.]|nr:FecR domain-containing protein [Novosphingobium sp.]
AKRSGGGEIEYRVRPGDTLYGLAARGFLRVRDYRVVQARNRISDPRKLHAGTVMRIPLRLLRIQPVSARIAAYRGKVTVDGGDARIGMSVAAGTDIVTQSNAFATVELADGSRLTVPSGSSLHIAELHRVILDGRVVRRFRLSNGRVEIEAAPLQKAGDRFEVLTPISVAAVRGTRFRASYSGLADPGLAGTAATGVIEGRVSVSGAGGERLLDSGKGVAVGSRGMGAIASLLRAPALQEPDRLQDGKIVDFAVEPMPDAGAYLAQLAADAGFVDIFAEQREEAPHMRFADVPDGSFFVRLTAFSASGMEGMPSVYTFERKRNDVAASVEGIAACPARRCLRFRWQAGGEGEARFRFQIAPGRDAIPIIDRDGMTAREIVITDLAPGTYYWRVESARVDGGRRIARWTEYQELQVTPLKR